jgi:hypothetical protein
VQVLSVNVTKLLETAQEIRREVTILTCEQGEVGDGERFCFLRAGPRATPSSVVAASILINDRRSVMSSLSR